jgi:tape measure domain-containing protein
MTDKIDIEIRDTGTPAVIRNLERIGSASTTSAAGVSMLQSAIAALGAAMSIDKLMQWSDAWNSVEGLVRTSTKNLSESAAVMERVYQAAQKTRTPLSEMGDLYTATARAGATLGASQEQVIRFSEGVGKALAIQHTTANQARGALIQLGQAIGMGNIRAQEYNSLLQNGQVILQTVAQNIEGVDGSITKLTAKVKDGGVTSKEFFDAFLKGAEGLDERFNETSFLFSQAFVVLGNAISKYLGQMDHALGISGGFVSFVKWISDNMPIAAGVVLGFGAALTVALAPTAVLAMIGYMRVLFALVLANPFTAFAALIAGVAVAIYTMRDAINLGLGDATTLGDLLKAIFLDVENTLRNVVDFASNVFEALVVIAGLSYKQIAGYGKQSAQEQNTAFQEFYADTGEGWLGFARAAAKTFDAIIGFMGGTVIFLKDAFLNWTTYAYYQLAELSNKFRKTANEMLETWFGMTNRMRDAIGLDPLEVVKIPLLEEKKVQFKDLGVIWAESMDAGFSTTAEKGMGQWLDGRIKLAQGLAASRGKGNQADLTTPLGTFEPPTDKDGKAAKALARLNEELERVIGRINPVLAAQRQLNEAQETFTKAVAAGLIPQAEADKYMAMLKDHLADALDPLKHLNEELDHKNALLKLSNREAQIEEDLYTSLEQLKRKGAEITIEETAALKAKLVVNQELNRIAQARDSMQGESGVQQMEEFQIQLKAMQELLANGGMNGGDVASQFSKMFPWADLSKSQEQMDAYVAQHQAFLDKIAAAEAAGVLKHETAEMLKAQADANFLEQRLAGQRSFFSGLSGLMSSSNKKLFAIGKAAAVTTAVIDGVVAVQKAYAGSPYPYNIAAAVTQGIIAASNVANIMSQQPPGFRTGGNMIVGGSGGDDSQLVQFRATPGERVTVNTPSQARAIEKGQSGGQPTIVKPKLAVFIDKNIMQEFVQSQEGEEVFQYTLNRLGYQPVG